MNLITISDLKKGSLTLSQLSYEFSERLTNKDFFLAEDYLIVYACLRQINFKKLNVEPTKIQFYCEKVLEIYFRQEMWDSNPIRFFLKVFLNFNTLPISIKIRLENEAKQDLRAIEDLIKVYNEHAFIGTYNEHVIVPRNHEERTLLEFYKRTLTKKNEVLDYLLLKVEDLAIEKAKGRKELFDTKSESETLKKMNSHLDFPYRDIVIKDDEWGFEIDFEKIDYRRINPLKNKRGYFKFESTIMEGYSSRIKKEIATKFDRQSAKKILNSTVSKINKLPVLNRRKKIFYELRYLYLNSKWYGFYALALPQIEGIFTEMAKIVKPDNKKQSSLTDKVKLVRPFSDYSEYSFDYYEYYLINQRNKFSHTGYDDEIKFKCSLLVIDLAHIVDVFEELNTPLIEISRILKIGVPYFTHIGEFSRFLELINKVIDNAQIDEVNDEIEFFVHDKLLRELNLSAFLKNLQIDFQEAANRFEENIGHSSWFNFSKELKIFSLTAKEINSRLPDIEKILTGNLTILFDDELKLLVNTNYFLQNFPKLFKNLPDELNQDIEKFLNANKVKIEIIRILDKRLKLDIPENFLLSLNKLQHRIK